VISALQNTKVPVAPTLAMCDDITINDAPFYVMSFVDGIIVRDPDIALKMLTPATRLQASNSLVDTMAAIHAVDPVAVGLGELGRHDGYIERQLKRWYSQWNASKTRELTAIDRVHDGLLTHLPVQGPATIVHGDYRLDNCMINSAGNIIAVLDWELCTLGDPLADLGLLMVYWSGPTDEPSGTTFGTTTAEGFLDRAQLDYYIAFAYWKLACIIEGVYARYISGAMGEQSDITAFEPFKLQVEASAQKAELLLSRLQ
jgi:aminoglycoside phosphotransferase (APT) family kinase protein